MDRRTFIKMTVSGATVGLAGCTNSTSDPTNTTETTTTETTTTENSEPQITNENFDLSVDLDYTVSITEMDETTPPKVTTTIKNPTDNTIVFGDKRVALFNRTISSMFLLHPDLPDKSLTEQFRYDEEHQVWVAKETLARTMEYQVDVLQPGETITNENYLVHIYPTSFDVSAYPQSLTFESTIRAEEVTNFDEDDIPHPTSERETIGFTIKFE